MKNKIKAIAVLGAFSLLLGMTSCQKDDHSTTPDNIVEAGVPTKMKLSVSIPKIGTRAEMDSNASTDEIMINTIDLFIYNDNELLLNHIKLTIDNFDQNGTLFTGNTEIPTTTGNKKFFVGTNLTLGQTNEIAINGPKAAKSIANVSEIASEEGLVMFSDVIVSKTLTSNVSENNVSLSVKRAVARVSVVEGALLRDQISGGSVDMVEFTVKNVNKTFYPLQLNDNLVIKDPNWASFTATDFYNDSEYTTISPQGVENRNLAKKYVTENTMQGTANSAYQDEATFASVRIMFLPHTILEYSNGTDASGGFKNTDNSGNSVVTFHTLKDNSGKTLYAMNKTVLEDYATANGLEVSSVQTYTDGYAYYHTYINKTNKFNIFRNDFYKINITKLIGLGEPAEFTPDHTEIPTETNMTVDIEILNWNLYEEDAELIGM